MRCVSARHAVADELVELAREVQLHAVRQVAAVGQVEPQHRVARLERGEVDRLVGLRAAVRLDVGVLGAEELLGPVAGEVLDHIDVLAAAVIPPAGIALGILVGQHAADRLHHRGAGVVFAGDHLQPVLLAPNSASMAAATAGSCNARMFIHSSLAGGRRAHLIG